MSGGEHKPYRNRDGSTIGLFSNSRSIRGHKKALEVLRREEAKFYSLFENSPIAMWAEDASRVMEYVNGLRESGITDLSAYLSNRPDEVRKLISLLCVVDVNRKALELYGASDKASLKCGLHKVITCYDVFIEEIVTLSQGETVFEAEGCNTTLQGEDLYLFFKLNVIPGYERSMKRVIVSMVDITARKRSEEMLRESESKYRAIVNAITEGIMISAGGTILEANETLYRMVGYTPAELAGIDTIPVLVPESEETVRRHIDAGLQEPYEVVFNRKDGGQFTAELHGRNIAYEGRPARLTVVIDITERKKLEEERERYIIKLEEANRVKSDFVSRVSHELRAPLTIVRGYLDLLNEGRLGQVNEQQAEALKVAREQSVGLQTLIEELLDLSRIESGRLEFHLEKVDIKRIIEETIDAFSDMYERKGLYMKCSIEPGLPIINGDSSHIRRAITNLLDNAYKFTPRGGVTISAYRENGFLRIDVADTGIGLSDKDMKHLFQRFFQAEPVLTRSIRGTGLGLYLTRELINIHGGKIWAESSGHGRGSVFTILLPIT
ncbi:MAG: PAS domain-containing sensor histidine kinase [bacterium]|nr:PAS domain-containing sensor histidine kinase [bacterium]